LKNNNALRRGTSRRTTTPYFQEKQFE